MSHARDYSSLFILVWSFPIPIIWESMLFYKDYRSQNKRQNDGFLLAVLFMFKDSFMDTCNHISSIWGAQQFGEDLFYIIPTHETTPHEV